MFWIVLSVVEKIKLVEGDSDGEVREGFFKMRR